MVDSAFSTRYTTLRRLLVSTRKTAGLSQTALAAKMGRLQTFVSKYERGERRLDVVEFLEVAAALKLDPHEVINQILAVDE